MGSSGVSILGLARSPTQNSSKFLHKHQFQYLGSRGAQLRSCNDIPLRVGFQYLGSRGAQHFGFQLRYSTTWFQYLGSRGAQLVASVSLSLPSIGFNTWAREEPNECRSGKNELDDAVSILGLARSPTFIVPEKLAFSIVSILGLARSPTRMLWQLYTDTPFQYLGSRGAQLADPLARCNPFRFQYLGSRGAQPFANFFLILSMWCFNTWAREEPNWTASRPAAGSSQVSILGLARSPTTIRSARR